MRLISLSRGAVRLKSPGAACAWAFRALWLCSSAWVSAFVQCPQPRQYPNLQQQRKQVDKDPSHKKNGGPQPPSGRDRADCSNDVNCQGPRVADRSSLHVPRIQMFC